MLNDSIFEYRPVEELFALVRNSLRKYDVEGLIDEGTLIKHVMWCNDKLGIPIREVREVAIPIMEFKGPKPKDFEKLYYVCALDVSNTAIHTLINPFDNSFDQDVIYEAHLEKDMIGCMQNCSIQVNRISNTTVHTHGTWTELNVDGNLEKICHTDCPMNKKLGKYSIQINDEDITTPFRTGTLYMMYIGAMRDKEGNILFPFHPLITPFYQWTLTENILLDMMFNSDSPNIMNLYKVAEDQRKKAWLDAFNITMEKGYGEWQKKQRQKELGFYNQYFKFFQ